MISSSTTCLNYICLYLDFRWPALRFDWKCKSSDVALPAPQKEVETKKEVESVEEVKDTAEASNATKCSTKLPKKENKEGKKSTGASMMDIGVWNPDAVKSNEHGNLTWLQLQTFIYIFLKINNYHSFAF